MFEPIAITASASVLPGARSVEELWGAVAEGRDLTSDAAEGAWGAGLGARPRGKGLRRDRRRGLQARRLRHRLRRGL